MLKRKKEDTSQVKPKIKTDRDNGSSETGNNELLAAIAGILEQQKLILSQQKDLVDRMDDIEKKKDSSNEAQIRMVNYLYNTDDAHIPELTRIPIQAARPHALGMMLESIFDEDVQSGEAPLSRKLRNFYFRLMRSAGGVHLGRGIGLAMEQATAETDKDEELNLGSGAE